MSDNNNFPPNDGINSFTGGGFLGADPEVTQSSNGNYFAKFSVGISSSYKKDGEWQKHTEWVKCVCFGYKAEKMEFANKGDYCTFTGELRTTSWSDQATGETKYMTETICNKVNIRQKAQSEIQTNHQQIQSVATTQEEEDVIPF